MYVHTSDHITLDEYSCVYSVLSGFFVRHLKTDELTEDEFLLPSGDFDPVRGSMEESDLCQNFSSSSCYPLFPDVSKIPTSFDSIIIVECGKSVHNSSMLRIRFLRRDRFMHKAQQGFRTLVFASNF